MLLISYILEHLCFNQAIFLSFHWKHLEHSHLCGFAFSVPFIWVAIPFLVLLVYSTLTSRPNTTSLGKLAQIMSTCSKFFLHSTPIVWTKSLEIVSYTFFRWVLGGEVCPLQSWDQWPSTVACWRALDKHNTQAFPFTVKFSSSLLSTPPVPLSILVCVFTDLN